MSIARPIWDGAVADLTTKDMENWIVNTTKVNKVFASGVVATCPPESENEGRRLLGVVVDRADIAVETCGSRGLDLLLENPKDYEDRSTEEAEGSDS